MAIKMGYTHPDDAINRQKMRALKRRKAEAFVEKIVVSTALAVNASNQANATLKQAHAPEDRDSSFSLPFIYSEGPKDNTAERKYLNFDASGLLHTNSIQDFEKVKSEAGAVFEFYGTRGLTPLRFELVKENATSDGAREWRGFGIVPPSFVDTAEHFTELFALTILNFKKQFGLTVIFSADDDDVNWDLEKKTVRVLPEIGMYDLDSIEMPIPTPKPLMLTKPESIEWRVPFKGTWTSEYVALKPGDTVPEYLHDHFAERHARYNKILGAYARAGQRVQTFVVYQEYEGATYPFCFYGMEKDSWHWNRMAETDLNPFTGDSRCFTQRGFGDIPRRVNANVLAHLDCKLAQRGLFMMLVPHEGDDIGDDTLGAMWHAQVKMPEDEDWLTA